MALWVPKNNTRKSKAIAARQGDVFPHAQRMYQADSVGPLLLCVGGAFLTKPFIDHK